METLDPHFTPQHRAPESSGGPGDSRLSLLDGLQVGIVILGPTGEVAFANRAALEMLGLEAAEVIGRSTLAIGEMAVRADGTAYPPEDHPGSRALASGRPVRGVVMGFYRRALQDRVWLLVNADPEVSAHGGVHRVVATFVDITPFKNAELRLQQSEARYRQLVEKAQDIIYGTDLNGFFTYVNPAASRLMGYQGAELIGTHFTELVREDHRQRVAARLVDQFRGRRPATYDEFPVLPRDGRELWIGQNVQLMVSGEGRVEGFQAVARDITERKRAQAATEAAQRRGAEFLASVGDELRTTLGRVIAVSGRLEQTALDAQQRVWVEQVRDSAAGLLGRIDGLLREDAARPSGARLQEEPSPPPLPAAAAEEPKARARILVAEDDPINRKVVLAMLERLGYEAQAVGNGLEAVEACARGGYDAVLMDCMMPEMDGYRATAWIRQREPEGRRVPVIALTASTAPGDREKCFASGMDAYVTKPMSLRTLDETLRRWVGSTEDASGPDPKTPASSLPLDHPLLALAAQGRREAVVEMIDLFLETTPPRLERLREVGRRNDLAVLLSLAHSLRAAALQLGARQVADLCAAIQTVAREGRAERLRPLFDDLQARFQEAARVLEVERIRLAGPRPR